MLRLKHLRHPLRTARLSAMRLTAYIEMWRFAAQSEERFRHDDRYDLSNVTNGFANRLHSLHEDGPMLERICRAYRRAVEHAQPDSASYEPTEWWKQVRGSCLAPVMRALQGGDIAALGRMYANLFRDPCATGLVGVPYGMAKAYFRGPMRDVHRRCYMGDALHRIDYWRSQTHERFPVTDLAGPEIGNPFGVTIHGTLVPSGAEYQHYCAHKILGRVGTRPHVVCEIGGGFGGTAYYLLRDGGEITYIDFDVPEGIALTSYYLLKAFPSLKFLLYGESDLTAEALAISDVVLLPLFEMGKMPAQSVGITFSSHVMADLSGVATAEYLDHISRMTKDYFLYLGDIRGAERLAGSSKDLLKLVEARSSAWNQHKALRAREGEYLYHFAHH